MILGEIPTMATPKPTGQIKNGLSGDLLVRLHRRLSTVMFRISPTCSGMSERERGRKDSSLIFIHGNPLGELSQTGFPLSLNTLLGPLTLPCLLFGEHMH